MDKFNGKLFIGGNRERKLDVIQNYFENLHENDNDSTYDDMPPLIDCNNIEIKNTILQKVSQHPICRMVAWGVIISSRKGMQFDYRATFPKKLVNYKGSKYGALYTSEVEGTGDVFIFFTEFSKTLDPETPGWSVLTPNQEELLNLLGRPSEQQKLDFRATFAQYFVGNPNIANDRWSSVQPYYFTFEYKKPQGKKKKITVNTIAHQRKVLDKLYRSRHNQLMKELNTEYRKTWWSEIADNIYIPQTAESITSIGVISKNSRGEYKRMANWRGGVLFIFRDGLHGKMSSSRDKCLCLVRTQLESACNKKFGGELKYL